jgi:hypothetical protein
MNAHRGGTADFYMNKALPYDLHTQGGGGGFIVFEQGDAIALPLLGLQKAVLRGAGGKQMVLDFVHYSATIEGEGMAELFVQLLAGRVRAIRSGRHADCVVDRVQVCDL